MTEEEQKKKHKENALKERKMLGKHIVYLKEYRKSLVKSQKRRKGVLCKSPHDIHDTRIIAGIMRDKMIVADKITWINILIRFAKNILKGVEVKNNDPVTMRLLGSTNKDFIKFKTRLSKEISKLSV